MPRWARIDWHAQGNRRLFAARDRGSTLKLQGRLVSKPWGQDKIPHAAGTDLANSKIGEVIFDAPATNGHPVMIKYLYTNERLSIQVHPDDRQARLLGHASGKDEMWIVLEAEPNATIGLGLKRRSSEAEVACAIEDGSIVDLVDWRPVSRGDVIYNRAGTIHAAGAGLVLLEVQQAVDLTYRLYDYGRPRELHLERGLAVSRFEPYHDPRDCNVRDGQSRLLADGPYFGAAWCVGSLPPGLPIQLRNLQLVVVQGEALVDGRAFSAGEAALVDTLRNLKLDSNSTVLLTWPAQEALTKAA